MLLILVNSLVVGHDLLLDGCELFVVLGWQSEPSFMALLERNIIHLLQLPIYSFLRQQQITLYFLQILKAA